MKCLVTGATGFIGRVLLGELQQAGHEVRAFSLHGCPGAEDPGIQALNLPSHALDPAQLVDVDVVYHLAGIAHQRAEADAYERVNVQATLQLARQAAAAGVPLFVFLSSVKAQQAEVETGRDPYGSSKYRAEQALLEAYATGPMTVVILRPALVYGAGVKGNLATLVRAVEHGMPRPPALGGRSMVSVADLARLLRVLAEQRPASTGVTLWSVTDGESYSTQRLYDALTRARGGEPGRAWLPLWCWRLLAAVLDLLTLSRPGDRYTRLFGSEDYDGSALGQALGWTAREVFEDQAPRIVAARSGRGSEAA
ncbi:NAD-dependent epimerase/dehydratase family protein [Halieaceae bacterium]|nr:NAD-dependent epimerase/dehydratase family protein [Halieaceae bacterium]